MKILTRQQTTPRTMVLLLLAAGLLAGCGDKDGASVDETFPDATPTPDVETDASPDPPAPPDDELSPTPTQEGVNPDGAEVEASTPGIGEVAAGVLREGSGGFGGVQSSCRPGCFVLVNAVARFCIESEETSSHLFFDGGRLVDAEPIPAGDDAFGGDRFDIASTFIDSKTSSAEVVEVIADGSEGLAVVRVTGREEPVLLLAGLLGPSFFPSREVEVVTEYRLRADSRTLEIVTFHTNSGETAINIIPGDIYFWGDTMTAYFPGHGASTPRSTKEILATGKGVAYGLSYEDEVFPVGLIGLDLPALPLSLAGRPLAVGERLATRRWFSVAKEVAGAQKSFFETAPEHPTVFQGVTATLTAARSGLPVAGAMVEITPLGAENQEDVQALFIDHTDREGQLELFVEPGRYRFTITDSLGEEHLKEADIAEGTEVGLELPATSSLTIRVDHLPEGAQTPLPSPAKVLIKGGQTGQSRLFFVLDGALTVSLMPGTYSWEISRGPEYTFSAGSVTMSESTDASIEAVLSHVMPTPGFISGEFHQHQSPSLDSEVPVVDRVLSNIAEGVDFAVSSDHEVATDFAPIITELGAEALIASLSGTEVSPLFGHFGAYPANIDPQKPGNGALPLAYKDESGAIHSYRTGEELISAIRNLTGARLVQSNHPRDSTGYFDSGGFDRSVGVSGAKPGFSIDFDTMEVVNGPLCEQLQDFYTLLNEGKAIIGVGNSDSHDLSKPVGYPRNYIPSTATSAAEISEDAIIDGTLTGDVVISAVAYLEFGPGGPEDPEAVRPGRLVDAEQVTIDVRAMTPPWAEVTKLSVIRNGLVVEELEIGAGPDEIVDFDGPITLNTEGRDAWFQIIVSTPQRLDVVYPGQRVYAMSNAFYLDADSSGSFEAPGLVTLDPATISLCQ